MGTLVHLSKQQNDFQPVPMEIVEPVPARPPSVAINPLARYSLRGQADSLERNMVNQVAILGRIALRGQATVLYAAPATGKTFLTIHLLCDAIERGVLEPEKLFYLNMDDNSNGLITKVRIAELHGFHMLAPGHKNFEAKLFASKLKEMTDGDTAKGVVVILDTLKKFTNLMDKGSSSEFGSLVRNFVMKGGSVIALAHTNKNPGADGKPIHAGTSDIVEDFDCAYTLAVIPVQSGEPGRGVEFANFKSRGASQSSVAYHYIPGNSYTEMMSTVREMDLLEFEPLKVAAAQAIEAPLIEAIRSCISDGIAPKMKLAIEASKRTKIGRNRIMAVIDKYTGDDIGVHFWRATTGARNAQTFECLKK